MTIPRMIVVAGPPGSGKSSIYPLSGFGFAYFNADDRAAELNGGSYLGISKEIRNVVIHSVENVCAMRVAKPLSSRDRQGVGTQKLCRRG